MDRQDEYLGLSEQAGSVEGESCLNALMTAVHIHGPSLWALLFMIGRNLVDRFLSASSITTLIHVIVFLLCLSLHLSELAALGFT